MIIISDAKLKMELRTFGQKVTLDRAMVVTVICDFRDQPGSPSIRCDIVRGSEINGEVVWQDARDAMPYFIEGKDVWEQCIHTEHSKPISSVGNLCGCELLEHLILFVEGVLVERGVFGEGAEVINHLPTTLKHEEEK